MAGMIKSLDKQPREYCGQPVAGAKRSVTGRRESLAGRIGREKKIGIIAGTGVAESIIDGKLKKQIIRTPYGQVTFGIGNLGDKEIYYLNRHGEAHCPAYQINYRANIWALAQVRVSGIFATATVGTLTRGMKPGDFCLLTDFLDFTRSRIGYFDNKFNTDVTFPYDEALRAMISQAAARLRMPLRPEAVYVCVEGPRFESPAEIKMFRKLGGDVVGMTQVPEVVLAAEKRIPYAVVGIITNYGAGLKRAPITAAEVYEMMGQRNMALGELVRDTIIRL